MPAPGGKKPQNHVNASIASRRSHHAGTTGIHSTVSKSRFGAGGSMQASRTVLSSSKSGRNLPDGQREKAYRPPVHVIDPDSGKDVTPQPLLHPSQVRRNQSNLLMDQGSQGGTPTDLQSQASMYQGTVNASTMFGGGPFTRYGNYQLNIQH